MVALIHFRDIGHVWISQLDIADSSCGCTYTTRYLWVLDMVYKDVFLLKETPHSSSLILTWKWSYLLWNVLFYIYQWDWCFLFRKEIYTLFFLQSSCICAVEPVSFQMEPLKHLFVSCYEGGKKFRDLVWLKSIFLWKSSLSCVWWQQKNHCL